MKTCNCCKQNESKYEWSISLVYAKSLGLPVLPKMWIDLCDDCYNAYFQPGLHVEKVKTILEELNN